jgi:phytoene synthase
MSVERAIFRNGSTTYYWSSKFFPRAVRDDVFRLYSFVRVADDYADKIPPRRAKFKSLRRAWNTATADPHFATIVLPEDTLEVRVVKNIVHVQQKYAFDTAWIRSFFDAMQADLDEKSYETLPDTLEYVYGSAEVIGLMMAKIMNLHPSAYEAAMLQGRAMQYINFIRDMREDYTLGRCYFPIEDLRVFGLADLSPETVQASRQAFKKFVALQLQRYREWQQLASEGFRHIPRRPRIAIKTAADMYNWTSQQIAKQPHLAYENQVKPPKVRVLWSGVHNAFFYH